MAEKETAATPGNDNKSGLLPVVAAFVAGVVLVALVAAGVVYFRAFQQNRGELAAQDQATQAACDFARETNTYDYQGDLDGFMQAMKDGATDNVVSSLEQNWDVLRQLLTESKVKSWIDDATCGFQSGDEKSAKVLVNIGLMKTNSVTPEPKRQDIAVVASLEKDGDRWIVNQWELAMLAGVGAQGGAPAPAGPAPAAPEGGAPAPAPGN
ncbi:hypothetical protein [Nocardia jinanensis]|uniref:Mce-associated membrane protein n=2 Tax=Nocardia jinanensis TaxID=382504 RepID=A0A917RSQ7_9NOCA|nr:hypothetical protein [Nocardia jinanensis]GGL26537.1 hypothetical protein GCM10011588_46700 [Nocardia jinanensis]